MLTTNAQLADRIANTQRQDLDDILSAARLCKTEDYADKSTFVQMFNASVGRLFCEEGATFGDAYSAYQEHERDHAVILGMVAEDLEQRDSAKTSVRK